MVLQKKELHSFDFREDYDNVEFFSVATTDYYRPGRTYKLFNSCGESEVRITFDIPQNIKNLKMLHMKVTEGCWSGMIDIFLNDRLWIERHEAVGPNWQLNEVSLPLDSDWLQPTDKIISMRLRDDAEYVYWLADATIEVSHLVPSSLVEVAASFVADMIKRGQYGEHILEDRSVIPLHLATMIKEWLNSIMLPE